MSDDTKLDQEQGVKSAEQQLQSRRRFAKSGLAGGAVMMSLLSRPASATYGGTIDPKCTGSILASIDAGTSLHDFDPEDCRFGCTPGFWQGGQPSERAWAKITQIDPNVYPEQLFENVFTCGALDGNNNIVHAPGFTTPGGQPMTLFDVVNIPNHSTADLKQAARHGLAALLNAMIMGIYYSPYTPAEIIADYCQAFAAWVSSGQTDSSALGAIHDKYRPLNERDNCPLNNNPNNIFYQ